MIKGNGLGQSLGLNYPRIGVTARKDKDFALNSSQFGLIDIEGGSSLNICYSFLEYNKLFN